MNPQMFYAAVGALAAYAFGRLATRGYLTPEQAGYWTKTFMDLLTLILVPGALAFWNAWRDRPKALAERAAAQAPAETMDKIVEQKPQIAMNSVENMAGVKMIVAEDHYAKANPNPNVVTATQAATRLSNEGHV